MLSRRDFTRLAAPAVLTSVTRAAPPKPNVLFVFSDDQRRDTISAYGNPHIRTPHLDGLVARSVNFRNAYCMGGFSAAVCLPSRMMLLRGVSWFTAQKQKTATPNMPETFGNGGYVTYHLGKRGNVDREGNKLFHHNNYIEPDDMAERNLGQPGRQQADRFLDFLGKWEKDPAFGKGKPFFAYLADSAPHDPRVAPPEYLERYPIDKIPLPNNYKPFHPFDNGEMLIRDEKLAPWPRTEQEVRKHLRDYYAVITYQDEQIGRILKALDNRGLRDNSIVVFSSDQGIAIGSHGLMGKQNLYQHSMNPALMFSGPGIARGKFIDGFAYLFDIFPTLCDLTGVAAPSTLEGRSQAPVIGGKQKSVRDTVFLAYRGVQRGVRQGRWKLLRYPDVNRTQLFDLEKDPDERNDLSADARHRDRISSLLAAMAAEQKRYGDPLPLTSPSPRDGTVTEAFFPKA